VVGKDYVSAVRNKEMTVDFHPRLAQSTSLFQECEGIKDNAISNDAAATGAQHAARDELQDKLLAVNDDGVAGVVSAGVTGYNRKVFRENVDDLAFAFIAPLGANESGKFCAGRWLRCARGRTLHARRDAVTKNYWDQGGEDVYRIFYRVYKVNSNAPMKEEKSLKPRRTRSITKAH
jgi:hypothetical protein